MPKSLFVDPSVVRAPSTVSFQDIPVNQYNKTVSEELESGRYTKEDLIRIFRDMAATMVLTTATPAPLTCPSVRKLLASARLTCWTRTTLLSVLTVPTPKFWLRLCPPSTRCPTSS